MTPNEVTQIIMEHARLHDVSLLDATIAVADQYEIELEDIAKHVTGSLKEMMQLQCESEGMLKRENHSSHTFE